jgi:hypothetical protein
MTDEGAWTAPTAAAGSGAGLGTRRGRRAGCDEWQQSSGWRQLPVCFQTENKTEQSGRCRGGEKGRRARIFKFTERPSYVRQLTDECAATYIHRLADKYSGLHSLKTGNIFRLYSLIPKNIFWL